MQIPVGAPHAFTAQKLIDFDYGPEVQAVITAYVNYVPPVEGHEGDPREAVTRSSPRTS